MKEEKKKKREGRQEGRIRDPEEEEER